MNNRLYTKPREHGIPGLRTEENTDVTHYIIFPDGGIVSLVMFIFEAVVTVLSPLIWGIAALIKQKEIAEQQEEKDIFKL